MKHWVGASNLDLAVRRYRSWSVDTWALNKFGFDYIQDVLAEYKIIINREMQLPELYENAKSQNDSKND